MRHSPTRPVSSTSRRQPPPFRSAAVFVVSLLAAGCTSSPGLSAPSPIIVPDVAVIVTGGSQTFSVFNATVRQFSLRSEGRPWPECVRVDQASSSVQLLRLIVTAPCGGLLYITADLGSGREPLVAVLTTE